MRNISPIDESRSTVEQIRDSHFVRLWWQDILQFADEKSWASGLVPQDERSGEIVKE